VRPRAPVVVVFTTLLAGCGLFASSPGPGVAEPGTDPAYVDQVDRWHAERIESLKKPTGWLSLAGLHWLDQDRLYSVGGAQADIPLPRASQQVGTLRKLGPVVQLDVAAGADVTVDGEAAAGSVDLRPDSHPKGASTVQVGDVEFSLIDRAGRLGIRVKDPQSAARTGFQGVARFPVSADWRITAELERHDTPTTLAIPTVIGTTLQEPTPGVLTFDHGGQIHTLHPVGDPDEGLFLVFGDASNGLPASQGGTYGGGRFLSVDWDGAADTVVLDFNKAYNPPCAFTEHATCPLPPPQNKLSVAVEAGEKALE